MTDHFFCTNCNTFTSDYFVVNRQVLCQEKQIQYLLHLLEQTQTELEELQNKAEQLEKENMRLELRLDAAHAHIASLECEGN